MYNYIYIYIYIYILWCACIATDPTTIATLMPNIDIYCVLYLFNIYIYIYIYVKYVFLIRIVCHTYRVAEPIGCLKLQVIFTKEPLIIGLFCGK